MVSESKGGCRFRIVRVQDEPIKVRMLDSLGRCEPLLRVEGHHLVHEVDGLLASVGNELAERRRDELRKGETYLGGKLIALRPLGLSRAAQDGTCLVDLVRFVVAREERPHEVELGHNRSHGEDVNR